MRNAYSNLPSLSLPAVSITSVRHKIKRAGYRIKPQYHPGIEVLYVDYGKLRLHLKNSELVLQTGDCAIIPANVRHFIEGDEGMPFDFLNVVFRGSVPESLVLSVFQLLPAERRIMLMLKEESEAARRDGPTIMLLKLNELLVLLGRRRSDAGGSLRVVGENRIRHQAMVVNKALNYLYEHLSQPLDCGRLSKYVGVSASHLRLLVHKETGITLRQHLRKLRIDFAKHLLCESSDNVDIIAYRCGYHSVPHFCTIFKRYTGMTASEFAKSLL